MRTNYNEDKKKIFIYFNRIRLLSITNEDNVIDDFNDADNTETDEVDDIEEILDDDKFDMEWSGVGFKSSSPLPLESTTESTFHVSKETNPISADVGEVFGALLSIFCFFLADDEKKDAIVPAFEELDFINILIYL